MVGIFDDVIKAWNRVDASVFGKNLAFDFVTHFGHGINRGSNKGNTVLIQGLTEMEVLREESISRMDCLCSALLDSIEDGFNV